TFYRTDVPVPPHGFDDWSPWFQSSAYIDGVPNTIHHIKLSFQNDGSDLNTVYTVQIHYFDQGQPHDLFETIPGEGDVDFTFDSGPIASMSSVSLRIQSSDFIPLHILVDSDTQYTYSAPAELGTVQAADELIKSLLDRVWTFDQLRQYFIDN